MQRDDVDPIDDPDNWSDGHLMLSEAIIKISEGMTALQKSGLNMKAIVVLLQAETKLPKRSIYRIIKGLADLEKLYCN